MIKMTLGTIGKVQVFKRSWLAIECDQVNYISIFGYVKKYVIFLNESANSHVVGTRSVCRG